MMTEAMMTEAFTTVGSTIGAPRERLDPWGVTAPRLALYAASVGVVAGVYCAAAPILWGSETVSRPAGPVGHQLDW
jgi:hypothetical protein